MWLLSTKTLKLEEFNKDPPAYAILSHRWEEREELSFGDLEGQSRNLKGYQKVKNFCNKAREWHFKYVWVDTCCIDKKSSAELSEAINSMYKWYQGAKICYVYLFDVHSRADLEKSSWFTRGWTLQELLAPPKLHFFDRNWTPISSRRKLAPKLHKITGISGKALCQFSIADYCVAEKLSWASQRSTLREEDRAYCLLGLFNVNMPLLYGEGERAFQRLQEEIMKVSTDTSLFLWQGHACETFGMLASDPSCFSDPRHSLKRSDLTEIFALSNGWTFNNAGISIQGSIRPHVLSEDFEEVFALYLHEPFTYENSVGFVIFLLRTGTNFGIPVYQRAKVNGATWAKEGWLKNFITDLPFSFRVAQLFITRQPLVEIDSSGTRGFILKFNSSFPVQHEVHRRPLDNPDTKLQEWPLVQEEYLRIREFSFNAKPEHATGLIGFLIITLVEDVDLLICLGLNHNFQPLCIALPFCNPTYSSRIDAKRILKAYMDASGIMEEQSEFFDPELHMYCFCGEDGALETATDIGIAVEISNTSDYGGKHEASLTFEVEKYIQHYLPTAEFHSDDPFAFLTRDEVDKLVQTGLNLRAKREKNYLFI